MLKQENKWADPQSFKDDAEFQRAYNVMWARAKAAEEIVKKVADSEGRMRALQTQIELEKAKHGIS